MFNDKPVFMKVQNLQFCTIFILFDCKHYTYPIKLENVDSMI